MENTPDIQLIALDFDGTLVPKDVPNVDLDIRTEVLLRQLRRRGVRLAVATGRHPSYIEKRIRKFRFDALIGYSGNVVKIDESLNGITFNPNMIRAVYDFAQSFTGVEMTLYSDQGTACASTKDSREALCYKLERTDRICDLTGVVDFLICDFQAVKTLRISRICLRLTRWELYEPLRREFTKRFSDFRLVKTGNQQVEILTEGHSKASELLKLAERFGFQPDQVACAGDDENDIEMLQRFDHSYYIGKAEDPLRQAASFCADSAAEVLEQLLNQKGENHV